MSAIPASMFPRMPDEVREMWLESIAEGHGWPFNSLDDSVEDSPWRYALAGKNLKEISNYRWSLSTIDLESARFTEISIQCIENLILQHIVKQDTPYANLMNSEERFLACADYIRKTGTIPRPVVALSLPAGYDILDGSHRLAAFFSIRPTNGYVIPAWVAVSSSDDHSPLLPKSKE